MRLDPLQSKWANGPVSWPFRLQHRLAFANATVTGCHARSLYQYSPTPLYLVNTSKRRSKARLLLFSFLTLIGFCLLSLLLPTAALAWGPGVHMVTGNWVLQNLAYLPPDTAQALMRYPGQYLHGILSADIFIGKGSKAKEGHSHNWDCGFTLLGKADNLRRQAYALGYLSHLAADTVAHNVYVPGTFGNIPGSGRLAHAIIESQADAALDWDSLDARGVFHEAGSSASERILRDTIRQKAWKYWVKKHVYEGSIAVGGSRAWRGTLALLNRLYPYDQRREMLDYMLTLSTRGIVSVLKDYDSSPVLQLDPIGADALALAGTQCSGPGLIVGSLKNILRKPNSAAPAIDLAAAPKNPQVNIIVPDLMDDFPQVCTPGGFMPNKCKENETA